MSYLFSSSAKALPPASMTDGADEKKTTDGAALAVCSKGGGVATGMKAKAKSKGKTGVLKVGKSVNRDGTVFNVVGRPPLLKVPSNNGIYRMVHSAESLAECVSSTTLSTFTARNFVVSNLGDVTSLAAVFDQYKIERVEVWYTPRHPNASVGPLTNMGLFHTVVDFDDSNVLTTVQQALDYQNGCFSSGADGHYRTWVPHVAVATYSGAFTSFANEEAPWIDAASQNVQHYGVKTAWTVTDTIYTMDLFVRLHTAWRNVR